VTAAPHRGARPRPRYQSLPFQFLRTDRRAWLALVLLFLVSLPAVTTRIYASDEAEYFSYLRSLWFDHDVSFENEYRYFHEHGLSNASGFRETFLERRTVTGRRENWGTVGCALLWSPFYAAGDLVARALHAAGRPVPVDGFSRPYVAAVCYGSAFYGFLALVLSAAAARAALGETGRRPAEEALAAAVIWVATPLAFYMYVSPPFSHACSAFAVAAFVFAWLRVRRTWSVPGFVLLGALGALMAMVREQDAFFAFGPGVDFLWTLARAARRRPTADGATGGPACSPASLLLGAAAGAAAFALAFLPQALAYLALNGRIGPSQVVSRKMYWWAPHALQVLLSPEHGVVFWTPLVMIALAGLAAWVARPGDRRVVASAFLVMLAMQVYVSGSVDSWSAAGGFGHRRFVGTTVVLATGLCALWRAAATRRARAGLAAAAVLCAWWNVSLMIQFGTGLMDRQQLDLARNARAAFIDVPARVPELAWRYMFDRESFYARPGGDAR
jgi:hypothetical protein